MVKLLSEASTPLYAEFVPTAVMGHVVGNYVGYLAMEYTGGTPNLWGYSFELGTSTVIFRSQVLVMSWATLWNTSPIPGHNDIMCYVQRGGDGGGLVGILHTGPTTSASVVTNITDNAYGGALCALSSSTVVIFPNASFSGDCTTVQIYSLTSYDMTLLATVALGTNLGSNVVDAVRISSTRVGVLTATDAWYLVDVSGSSASIVGTYSLPGSAITYNGRQISDPMPDGTRYQTNSVTWVPSLGRYQARQTLISSTGVPGASRGLQPPSNLYSVSYLYLPEGLSSSAWCPLDADTVVFVLPGQHPYVVTTSAGGENTSWRDPVGLGLTKRENYYPCNLRLSATEWLTASIMGLDPAGVLRVSRFQVEATPTNTHIYAPFAEGTSVRTFTVGGSLSKLPGVYSSSLADYYGFGVNGGFWCGGTSGSGGRVSCIVGWASHANPDDVWAQGDEIVFTVGVGPNVTTYPPDIAYSNQWIWCLVEQLVDTPTRKEYLLSFDPSQDVASSYYFNRHWYNYDGFVARVILTPAQVEPSSLPPARNLGGWSVG